MTRRCISQKDYHQAIQLFHWATKEHFIMWFTGSLDRHRRTESMLPRQVKKGKFHSYQYGKRLVYVSPRRDGKEFSINKLEHGLGCTEGLVRVWRSNMEGVIVQEHEFKGLGCMPEWGIKYPNGSMLLYEYSTKDNCNRSGLLKRKIIAYQKNIPAIDEAFGAKSFVLFVLDIPRERVIQFIEKNKPFGGQFMFTDYQTFKSTEIGKTLSSPIYLWEDGKEYPLD